MIASSGYERDLRKYNKKVKLIHRIYVNQFIFLSFLVAFGLFASVIAPSPFVNFTTVLLSIFALSGVMPTSYSNLRIVYAFAYISIVFGLYLVLRGFSQLGPISKYDFAVCILLLSILALSPKFLGRKKSSSNFKLLNFSFVSGSTTLVFCFAFGAYLISKGIGFFLAWSGSGDSRNHIQVVYNIAFNGYLDLIDLGSPLLTGTIVTFLNSGSPIELGSDSSFRLLSDWTSYSLTWALLICILGYAFAAVWEVVLPQSSRKSIYLVLIPASALSLTSLSLGTFLLDGFITATAGAISVAFATALLFDSSPKSSVTNLFTLFLVATLALFSWTFIVIPVLIMMVPLYIKWLNITGNSFWIWARVLFTLMAIAVVWHRFSTYYLDLFLAALDAPGSISTAHPHSFKILLVGIVVLASISSKRNSPTIFQLSLVAFAAASFILILNKASGIPLTHLNYYSSKAMMILFVGLLPTSLLFIPKGLRLVDAPHTHSAFRIPIACALVTVLTQIGAQYVSPFPGVLGRINAGWEGPNANTVSQILPLANDPLNPVVFVNYLASETYENRIANFWLGTYAEPWDYYQSWSYLSEADQTGDYPAFCFLNRGYPQMTVYTRDENFMSKMRAYCRDEKMIINIIR